MAKALKVENKAGFEAWSAKTTEDTSATLAKMERWQQFVVRMLDERGDPVSDYFLEFFTLDAAGKEAILENVTEDAHAYEADKSFRCFHVNLDKLQPEKLTSLWLRVVAESGTEMVCYTGFDDSGAQPVSKLADPWRGQLRISDEALGSHPGFKLFYPFTTTLVEIVVNREPNVGMPRDERLCTIGCEARLLAGADWWRRP